MGKDWDYANLTHDAKEAGGPGNYIDKVHKNGKVEGFIEGLITVLVPVLTFLGVKVFEKHQSKKIENDKKIASEKLSEYLEREDEEEKDNE